MKTEKINCVSMDCKPRKLDFIRYSNKSYTSNHFWVVDAGFVKSLNRENSLFSSGFLA